ncbi:hypothetical protein ACFLT4_04000 [Chloroflexota bacterium]
MYEVLSPLGEVVVEDVSSVRRLSDLKGKTICEVGNGAFRAGTILPMIGELLKKRYPGLQVIPHTAFPVQAPTGNTEDLLKEVDTAVALMKEKGCDALITATGG